LRYFLITYKKKANGQIDEEVSLSRHIRQKDIQMCNIIMDFATQKVDKCLINGKSVETTWNDCYAYYKQVYPSLIEGLDQSNKKEGV
jgi:hypothetical protein